MFGGERQRDNKEGLGGVCGCLGGSLGEIRIGCKFWSWLERVKSEKKKNRRCQSLKLVQLECNLPA